MKETKKEIFVFKIKAKFLTTTSIRPCRKLTVKAHHEKQKFLVEKPSKKVIFNYLTKIEDVTPDLPILMETLQSINPQAPVDASLLLGGIEDPNDLFRALFTKRLNKLEIIQPRLLL